MNVNLNEKGLAVLVALCRYIEQHGNVTKDAGTAANVLRRVFGDNAPRRYDEAHYRIVFGESTKTAQQELTEAVEALRK